MYKLLYILILSGALFTSCRGELTPEEFASLTAKGYYEHLAAGEYDDFLDGVSGVKEAPDDYRLQHRVAMEQYMKRVKQQHGGISSVEVSSAKTDSTLHCTNVFLILCFGDSTKEEVCVPMVQKDGVFLMR